MLKKPSAGGRRRRLLLVAVLICLAVPCVAAVPHALRVGINPTVENNRKQPTEDKLPTQPAIENEKRPEQITAEADIRQNLGRAENAAERHDTATRENRLAELEATKRRAEEQARERDLRARQEVENAELERRKQAREWETRRNEENRPLFTEAQIKEFEANARSEREAKAKRQIELVKQARITMQQAVRIATNRQAGTVMECSLARERDIVFYRVLIVSGGERETVSTRLSINAIDGQIMSVNRE